MPVNFSTPTGSVTKSFPTSLKAFGDSGLLDPQPGTNPVQYSSPTNAPVAALPGQLVTH